MSMKQQIKHLPSDDKSCGWLNSLPMRSTQSLDGDEQADWVIVGAGFTGLGIARQLAEHRPQDRIVLIDAQQVAEGASGRNSGFLIDLPHNLGASDYIGDLTTARRDMALNEAGISYLKRLVNEYGIECHWRECGKIQGAANGRGVKVLKAYRQGLDRLGVEYSLMDAGAMKRKLGTEYYLKGMYTPGSVLVQPAALARGLADSLPENVTLYEQSSINAIEYADKIKLHSKGGTIRASNLILANNFFAKEFGFLRGRLLPVFTYSSMSRKLNENEQSLFGGDPYWGVIPADPFGSTVRRTADQRVLIRNSFTFNPTGKSNQSTRDKVRVHHQNSFDGRFPFLQGVELEHTWGGVMCLSRNHAPFFGKLRDNVFGSFCHNGLGVTKGTITGKLLADLICEQPSELLSYMNSLSGPAANPPEPLLSIGVNAT
ncbi:MAG: FAD-binding oxidoreductase, partial [Amphritea sp.]|nr:FAD-binding oxidoreductase [Amphritea sp.]